MIRYIIVACFITLAKATLMQDACNAFYAQDFTRACELFKQAYAQMPDQHALLYNMACCYEQLGDRTTARTYCEDTIAANPTYVRAYQKLVELINPEAEPVYAQQLYTEILKLEPHCVKALIGLGKLHLSAGAYADATACFCAADKHEMDHVTAFELAYLLSCVGLFTQAAAVYERMLPDLSTAADLYHNLGYCLRCAGKFEQAIAAYQQGLVCDPEHSSLHFGLAMAYIFQGDYAHGWKLHQRFLTSRGRNADKLRSWFTTKEVAGKTILLSPEGGLGDTLQFVRYARELKKYGIQVAVATQPALYKLLSRCPYIDRLYRVGDFIDMHIDDWTTLMSMAPILYTYEQQLPDFSPYLYADPQLVEHWHNHFADDHQLKVGLCWQASVQNDVSRPAVARRGISLSECIPLMDIPHVSFYSLQQEDGVEQIAQLPSWITLHCFDATFDKTHGAFEDTAAVIEHLDLVITIDSAVAHLAGAMGKEVWLLLPYATDWRWVHDATTTAWYPRMRIFKQAQPFDWQEVIERVCVALIEKVAHH